MMRRQQKGRKKTPEEINKIREGRYKFLYGDNWKDVLDTREKARQEAIALQEKDQQIRVTLTPRLYGDSFLGKTEFCRLLILRLRNPQLGDLHFCQLASLFAAIKQWLPNKQEATRKVFPIKPRAQKFVDNMLAEQGELEEQTEQPIDQSAEALNELVRKLEEQQKRSNDDGQLNPERDSA